MKSLQQLLNKLSEDQSTLTNVLDFNNEDLLQFLPFDKVGYYLKPDVTGEEWEGYYRPLKRGNVIGIMSEYMKLAWEYCLARRKKSARITIRHYHAWLWILEDEGSIEFLLDDKNYACYGTPILYHICEKYNWELKSLIENWQIDTAKNFIEGVGC